MKFASRDVLTVSLCLVLNVELPPLQGLLRVHAAQDEDEATDLAGLEPVLEGEKKYIDVTRMKLNLVES